MDDDNQTVHVLDWQGVLKMAEDGRKRIAA
jgi:hypothetical protein